MWRYIMRSYRDRWRWLILSGLLGLGGCALSSAPTLSEDDPLAVCRAFLSAVDTQVAQADADDAQATRIEGFPGLRVNRYLADAGQRVSGEAEFAAWLAQLRDLGRQGQRIELANLAEAQRRELVSAWQPLLEHDGLVAMVDACADRIQAQQLAGPGGRQALIDAARVPDDYSTGRRFLGAYYLTALPVSAGVSRWHRRSREVHATPAEELPVHGELVRFEPPPGPRLSSEEVATLLAAARDNPLALPLPDATARALLFRTHAPAWEIDVVSADDRIGTPFWPPPAERPEVDITQPRVYRHVSHVRWQGETLLQLNYVVWFPARPKTSFFDPLGGHMDGVIWRVTLGGDGEPLMYDTIHACGCYHGFYPAQALRVRPREPWYEGAFVPLDQPLEVQQQPLVLRLAHRTHHVEHVGGRPAPEAAVVEYDWAEYDQLRSLPLAGGHRSLFTPAGMVAGTQRGERWFLWPMGVVNPGAMRQWGRHATAFVGRRHFDAPDLLKRDFEEQQ